MNPIIKHILSISKNHSHNTCTTSCGGGGKVTESVVLYFYFLVQSVSGYSFVKIFKVECLLLLNALWHYL